MDPIKGVLDEAFFKAASPECMEALSRLVDDALALRFINYLNSTTLDNPVAKIINNYLGPAIKSATFHLHLIERGSPKIVEKIELETISNMRFDQRAVIEELEFLEQNIQFVRSYIEPRKKSDYDAFLASLPPGYKTRVSANRVMFYQPHARARATGVGIIIRRRDAWSIALKGLKFREYFARAGYAMDGYMLKEF